MIVRFRPAAAAEVQTAREWYAQQREGLGADFVKELRATVAAIKRGPTSFPLMSGSKDLRRALMSRFPYGVFFVVSNRFALVLAVAHLRREPGYWKH